MEWFKPVTVMWILLAIPLFLCIKVIKNDYVAQKSTVNEIGDSIVDILCLKHDEYGRIKELKEKIKKVKSYAVDNDIFADLLSNVTNETQLNETNFYESLKENDHFRFLAKNDSTNLYLKLKARMNRDDILKLLAVKGEKENIMKSARRMLKDPIPKKQDDEKMNDIVDKLLGEVPRDSHKTGAKESIYWDPQGELEDLKEYYDTKRDTRRLFKGVRSTIREYPFMVSVHIMGRFWCGGALYWSDLVITSASCLQLLHNNRFFRENPRVLQVRIGSNHSRIGGEILDITEVYFHPGYNPRTLSCNLALIRLRRHLAFSYHRVPKIIAISDIPTSIPSTADITVLGWGVTKTSQKLSYEPVYLQKKNLPVYPNTFCKEIYGSKFITSQMFCAGTLTTGEGACDHDAGGPAILSGRLVGIISYGPAICGISNVPTVFTLIGAFSDWIESVNESMPLYYQGRIHTTTTPKSLYNEYFVTWKHPSLIENGKKHAASMLPVSRLTTSPSPKTITISTTETTTVTTEEEEVVTEPETTTTEFVSPALRLEESDEWTVDSQE